MTLTPSLTLQRNTLNLYGELLSAHHHAKPWPGQLILTAGAGSSASGLPAAASITGATALAIDPEPNAARAALREGGVDFVVNTLDEALRVLKNQVRQHRPLGVALTADPQPVLAEAAERGLRPDLILTSDDQDASMKQLLASLGSELWPEEQQASAAYAEWLTERGWSLHLIGSKDAVTLRKIDALLLTYFDNADPRTTWLRGIVRYQRSAAMRERALWLSEADRAWLQQHSDLAFELSESSAA